MKKPEPLNFKVSSALKSIIGKDLITNDFVAIFELVKNSFDAGAKRIDIFFDLSSGKESKIIILDDGKGMSYEDILEKWLFVAYSAKENGTEDSVQKIYAGNKGVGRFSCDRLGRSMKLQTKTASSNEINVLEVEWNKFEGNSKRLFSEIGIDYTTSNAFDLPNELSPPNSGVAIEITELKELQSWDRKKLLSLKRHLSKLIDPFGREYSPVEIIFHCESEKNEDDKRLADGEPFATVNGKIENRIFSTLKAKTTSLKVFIEGDSLISELVDRGERIYKIRESLSDDSILLDSEFEAELFYLNMSAKQTFAKRMSISSVSFGSLLLFRNGFRVFPVGERGDDYWGMDSRKQQGFARYLGTRDVLGRIDIRGTEEKFRESSSRDKGLIETPASQELDTLVWEKCIKRLENYVVGVQWKDALDKESENTDRLKLDSNRSRLIELISKIAKSDDIEVLDYNINLVDVLEEKSKYFESSVEQLEKLALTTNNKDLLDRVAEARKSFVELKKKEEEALKKAEEERLARKKAEQKTEEERLAKEKAEQEASTTKEAYEVEKSRNYFLLSSGNRDKEQLESFLHQIIIYASDRKQGASNLLQKIRRKGFESISENELVEFLTDQQNAIEKIITTSRFATSANFILDSAEVEADMSKFIEQYLAEISTAYNSRINIEVQNSAKEFISHFTPIELGMVLDNIVDNAKKAKASNIKFNIKSEGNKVLSISATNNGRPLDTKIIEPNRIFERGFTTSLRGSGLGLAFCKEVIEKFGGEIGINPVQPKTGISFIIRFQKQ